MAAIITDEFRKNNIERFIDDVSDSPAIGGREYYIGIGKTDPWERDANGFTEADTGFTPDLPDGSRLEKEDIKKNLITLKRVRGTDILRLMPQVPFAVGNTYKVYDPTDPSCFDADRTLNTLPCYALYVDSDGNSKTYVCLGNNNGAATSQVIPAMPAGVNYPYGAVQNANDKYIWAHEDYFNKSSQTNLFSSSKTFLNITPDANVDTIMNGITGHGQGAQTTGTYDDGRKRATQASAGLLYGFKIDNPGLNYPKNKTGADALSAEIIGEKLDGSDIAANNTLTVETDNDGSISKINWTLTQAQSLGYGRTTSINSAGATTTGLTATNGGGIKRATLVITDATVDSNGIGESANDNFVKADIKCLIAPEYGFGHSPLDDMPSYYAGISADFAGTVGDNSQASALDTPPQYIGESLVDIQFRQVSLIRDTDQNLSLGEDDSPWPDATLAAEDALNCLKYFQISDLAIPDGINLLGSGSYIEQAVSGGEIPPRAWLDKVSRVETGDPSDSPIGGYRIYYHQNSDRRINQKDFDANGSLKIFNVNKSEVTSSDIAYTSIKNGEYRQDAGDVLFVDNRKPITRNEQQTEEVRLIIQF